MLLIVSVAMALVVLADIARVETCRIAVYPKPLFPHLQRYGWINLKLYRRVDYGRPAIASLYIATKYNRQLRFKLGARS